MGTKKAIGQFDNGTRRQEPLLILLAQDHARPGTQPTQSSQRPSYEIIERANGDGVK